MYTIMPHFGANTIEAQSYRTLGEKGIRKSEIVITLKSSLSSRFDAVLYIFHKECAAVITMEHKSTYIEAKTLLLLS